MTDWAWTIGLRDHDAYGIPLETYSEFNETKSAVVTRRWFTITSDSVDRLATFVDTDSDATTEQINAAMDAETDRVVDEMLAAGGA